MFHVHLGAMISNASPQAQMRRGHPIFNTSIAAGTNIDAVGVCPRLFVSFGSDEIILVFLLFISKVAKRQRYTNASISFCCVTLLRTYADRFLTVCVSGNGNCFEISMAA